MTSFLAPSKQIWASASQYAEAVQCPQLCFTSQILRECEPAFDRLGMPIVTSGQFAYVFKLKHRTMNEAFAARCFRQHLGDREERYRAINAHLKNHPVSALSKFEFDSQGILVNGRKYPLLIMPYLEGQTFDVYLAQVLERKDVLQHLAGEWAKLVRSLRDAGIAHGDLQHGNIIIGNGQLHLVDFDGVFVPALRGRHAVEIGHQHFQHPKRTQEHFDENLDNFSALSIYVTLLALRERPALWREYHDENLLFTKEDFLHPAKSALFAKLKAIGGEVEKFTLMLERAALDENPLHAPDFTESVEANSKLPAWMTAPLNVKVEKRTREAKQIDVPRGVIVTGKIETPPPTTPSKIPIPTTISSQYQTIFSSPQAAIPATGKTSIAGRKYDRPITSDELLPATWDYATAWIQNINRKSIGGAIWVVIVFGNIFIRVLGEYTPFAVLIVGLLWFVVSFIRALSHWNLLEFNSTVSPALPSYTNRAIPTQLHTANAFVGNIIPRIYHLENCRLLDSVPINERAYFVTIAQAQHEGYRACTACLNQSSPSQAVTLSTANSSLIIGSKNSRIYHLMNCYLVDAIAVYNREDFSTVAEAQQAGYRSCRICKP